MSAMDFTGKKPRSKNGKYHNEVVSDRSNDLIERTDIARMINGKLG
jgi:hypothetical protein